MYNDLIWCKVWFIRSEQTHYHLITKLNKCVINLGGDGAEETNHADQVTAQKIPNLRPFAHVLPHVLPHLIPGPPDRHGH